MRAFESDNEVVVIWDNGTAANYRCSSASLDVSDSAGVAPLSSSAAASPPGGPLSLTGFDLRVFDAGAAGVVHEPVQCEGCRERPLSGVRYRCLLCADVNLCAHCYNADRHSLKHPFEALVLPGALPIALPARRKAKRFSLRGLLPGARVARGADWNWSNQDGGPGHRGRLLAVQNWNKSAPRSAAYVQWDTGLRNLYRLGFDGMCDLIAVAHAKGASVYRDHLPCLGDLGESQQLTRPASAIIPPDELLQHVPLPLLQAVQSDFEREQQQKRSTQLARGDPVHVELAIDAVQTLQVGHGGWTDGMLECLSSTGIVLELDRDGDALVLFPSGNRWTLNPSILSPVNRSSSQQLQPQRTVAKSMSSLSSITTLRTSSATANVRTPSSGSPVTLPPTASSAPLSIRNRFDEKAMRESRLAASDAAVSETASPTSLPARHKPHHHLHMRGTGKAKGKEEGSSDGSINALGVPSSSTTTTSSNSRSHSNEELESQRLTLLHASSPLLSAAGSTSTEFVWADRSPAPADDPLANNNSSSNNNAGSNNNNNNSSSSGSTSSASAAPPAGAPVASPPEPLQVGDLVRVCPDIERLKLFQRGHGMCVIRVCTCTLIIHYT